MCLQQIPSLCAFLYKITFSSHTHTVDPLDRIQEGTPQKALLAGALQKFHKVDNDFGRHDKMSREVPWVLPALSVAII